MYWKMTGILSWGRAHYRADSLEEAASIHTLWKVRERGEVSSLKLRNGVGLHERNEEMINSPLCVSKGWKFLFHEMLQKSNRNCCHLPRDCPSMAMLPSISIARISVCVHSTFLSQCCYTTFLSQLCCSNTSQVACHQMAQIHFS